MQQDRQIFLQAVRNLGLKPNDLQPVGIYDLQLQSRDITSNMAKNQKQFYLFKKSQALEEYRLKLLKKVEQQIQRLKKYTYNNKKVNPMIENLLKQHEKLRNSKIQKINRMKKQQDKEKSNKSHSKNSLLDFGKTSPICLSRKTSYSAHSRNSRRSETASKSSVKQRLERVREKQIQTASYKRLVLQKKMQQNSRKAIKAEQFYINKSRNIKTKSDISKTIVLQNRQKRKQQEKMQIVSTFQKIKEKNDKAELILNLKKSTVKKKIDFPYKLMRNSMQNQYKDIIKHQYQRKMAMAAFRKEQNVLRQRYTIDVHKHHREQKKKNLQDYINFRNNQQKVVSLSIVNKQKDDLIKAEQRRQQKQTRDKMRFLQEHIRQEINLKNKSIIEQRKSIQTQNKNRKKIEKYQEIQDIMELKRYLRKDLKLVDIADPGRYRQSFSMSQKRY